MSGKSVKVVVSVHSMSYDINRLIKELGSLVERQEHEVIFTSDEDV